ncbi:(d)CMP kinase [Atopobiaceae bacterium 24-176]
MIVVIDGPAGSGKSTVARALARREGFTYLDTGAMYRAVTLAALERGVDVQDAEALGELARSVSVAFGPAPAPGAAPTVLLDGRDVTSAIRTAEVDSHVSAVSGVPAVREAMVAQQRAVGAAGDVVAEGRDMGTVVFPGADVKVFLSADARARARRRTMEREGTDPCAPGAKVADEALFERIYQDILARDAGDRAHAVGALRCADDAVRLDSTSMTPEQVIDSIASLVADARTKKAAAPAPAVADSKKPADTPAPAKPSVKAKAAGSKGASAPMRPFHNTWNDYYDHGMAEFPLPSRMAYSAACALVYGFTRLYWPWRFEDLEPLIEELKTRPEGTVVVMNHVSMVEPVICVVMFWRHGLRVRPVFKKEFNRNDLTRWVFTRVGGIPVDRGTADLKAVRRSKRAIQRGESVLIYPEGTRVRSDDATAEIHGGFALIARMAKTDVTPMAVVGARDVTPEGKRFPRPHRVFFKVGRPIKFGSLGVKGRREQLDAMERRAMDRVWELRAELRREHPGEW